MLRRRRAALPANVKAVGNRIEKWRRRRKKRSPMPEQLWREAAVLARCHGVYRISQVLRVTYETLRRWTAKSGSLEAKKQSDTGGFVEVVLPRASATEAGPVVELADGDGSKLTIRLPAHSTVDVSGLANAWWSRRL